MNLIQNLQSESNYYLQQDLWYINLKTCAIYCSGKSHLKQFYCTAEYSKLASSA